MELPIELLTIIREYSQPCTRPDWRKGSFIMHHVDVAHFKNHMWGVFSYRYSGWDEDEDDDEEMWFVC